MLSRRKLQCRQLGCLAVLAGAALALGSIADARAQALEKLTILIFSPPSLGAFMPPVIKAQKFDQANGLDITFQERTPDAYAAQFNSGEFKIGGSASLQTIALGRHARRQGEVPVQPVRLLGHGRHLAAGVKTLKDLEGKQLAGARSTTNYVMFEFFAKRHGVDVSKIQVVNTAPPGPHRATRSPIAPTRCRSGSRPTRCSSPRSRRSARSTSASRRPGRSSPAAAAFPISGSARTPNGPTQNPELVQKLYTTYKAAAEWIQKNPEAAAPLIVPTGHAGGC